jgi:predicted CXXCH cytochrome family protein
MSLIRSWFPFAAMCFLAFLYAAPTVSAAPGDGYVGSDTCRSCHDEPYDSFAASPHAKLLDSHEASRQGCEACHGPGAEHVNSNGEPSKIFRFQSATAEAVRTRCSACHAELPGNLHKQHSISCLKCHSSHHYADNKTLLSKAVPALCQACHR